MKRKLLSNTIIIAMAVFGLTACHKVPDHVKYIPKDAAVVVGIDLKGLTKKVAWNAIMGSKLFREMQKDMHGKTTQQNFEDIGIDLANTLYLYVSGNKNIMNGGKVVAVLPLDNVAKLEAFIKSTFPAAAIKEHNKIKTAMLSQQMYAGWNDKVLMVTNVATTATPQTYTAVDGSDSTVSNTTTQDESELATEMEANFNQGADNSILKNPRYVAFEKERHDVLLWMNYEQISDKYMYNGQDSKMGNLQALRAFWKDAAFTAGLDFEKGHIAATMRYYISGDWKDLGKELGGTNVSSEVINKLPAQNLDFLFAGHLNTKGIHDLLDKFGLIGLANLALLDQGIDADYILDAFTGDMALSVNDFRIKQNVHDSAMNDMEPYEPYSPSVHYTFILKIKKKENFEKLLSLGKNMIVPRGNNTFLFNYGFDSVGMAYNDQYAVVSNNTNAALACLQNKSDQKLPVPELYGHPVASFTDFQQLMLSVDPASKHGSDSLALSESKKMFQNLVITGGEFKDDNFSYNLKLNFVNKDENSLLQVIDYGVKLSEGYKAPDSTYSRL